MRDYVRWLGLAFAIILNVGIWGFDVINAQTHNQLINWEALSNEPFAAFDCGKRFIAFFCLVGSSWGLTEPHA